MCQIIQRISLILLATVFVAGCATSRSGNVYSRNEARQVQYVELGTIVALRPVTIEGTKSNVGTLGGAVLGGIAGSKVGGGRGAAAAAVVGAIVGGIAGAAAEEGATRQNALEITLRLDSGKTVAVVQADDTAYTVGERVRLLTDSYTNEARISR